MQRALGSGTGVGLWAAEEPIAQSISTRAIVLIELLEVFFDRVLFHNQWSKYLNRLVLLERMIDVLKLDSQEVWVHRA